MAATIAGMLKARIEAAGLGLSVFRDAAPRPADGTDYPMPYVTVRENVAMVPDADGAYDDDPAAEHTAQETVQVDLWQRWRDPETGRVAEDYALPGQVRRLLHGATGWTGTPFRVRGSRVVSAVRLLEEQDNVVHHALTVVLSREV